jgi:hypothetical protein
VNSVFDKAAASATPGIAESMKWSLTKSMTQKAGLSNDFKA